MSAETQEGRNARDERMQEFLAALESMTQDQKAQVLRYVLLIERATGIARLAWKSACDRGVSISEQIEILESYLGGSRPN